MMSRTDTLQRAATVCAVAVLWTGAAIAGEPRQVQELQVRPGDVPLTIEISWQASPEQDVTHYVLLRRDEGSTMFVQIAAIDGRLSEAYIDLGGASATNSVGGLAEAKEYAYTLTAFNTEGTRSKWAVPAFIRTSTVVPPPQNLTATTNEVRKIKLGWQAGDVTNVAHYTVETADHVDAPFSNMVTLRPLAAGKQVALTQKGMLPGEVRFYRVATVDRYGTQSGWSPVVRGATRALPMPPDHPSLQFLPKKVSVSWNATGRQDIAFYRLWRQKSEGAWINIGEYRDPPAILERTEAQQYGTVALTAIGTDGQESRPSAPTEVKPPPPRAPAPLQFLRCDTPAARTVRVFWDPPDSKDIEHYIIERAPADFPAFEAVARTAKADYTDIGSPDDPLLDNTAYLYRVRIVTRVGATGEPSDIVRAVTRPPPAAVQSLLAVSGDIRRIPLSWAPSPEDDVTRYGVYRAPSESGPFALLATVQGRSTAGFVDGKGHEGLPDGATYYYKVRAESRSAAQGDDSRIVAGTTRPPPATVKGVYAESERAREVLISWDAGPDVKITGYVIGRADPGADEFREVARVDDRLTTSYLDRGGRENKRGHGGLSDETEYHYRVCAINSANVRSAWSDPVRARTKPSPARPVIKTASIELPHLIRITWTANPEKDIKEYVLASSSHSGKGFREVARIPAGGLPALASVESGLYSGEPRYYLLQAVDADGLSSPWSEEMAGRARSAPEAPQAPRTVISEEGATLSWTASTQPDVVGYKVWRKSLFRWHPLRTVREAECKLEAELIGRGATLSITSLDKHGIESRRSPSIKIVLPRVR